MIHIPKNWWQHFQWHTYMCFILLRVVKDTLCSSGANATLKHIEEVSLSALFLADAAKKADRELGLPTYSGKHTAHDAQRNINQIARHLQNYQVTKEVPERTTPVQRPYIWWMEEAGRIPPILVLFGSHLPWAQIYTFTHGAQCNSKHYQVITTIPFSNAMSFIYSNKAISFHENLPPWWYNSNLQGHEYYENNRNYSMQA